MDDIKTVVILVSVFSIIFEIIALLIATDIKEIKQILKESHNMIPKTGEWIQINDDTFFDGQFQCTECHKIQERLSKFCPNCGADMRGDNNEIN